MLPSLLLVVTASPSFDPTGPEKYTPTYVPAEAPYGYFYQPAYDVLAIPRPPATPYLPKSGDVILFSDTNVMWSLLFHLALTGKPGHNGIVVTMPGGRLGLFESGYNNTAWSRVTPLEYRINQYAGFVWVRSRIEPLTEEQDRRLTEFAMMSNGRLYAIGRYLGQLTPFRTRGPLRTRFLGKPIGPGHRYYCSQATVEALLHTGVIDRATARPGATFPQDLFYDRSRNLYIDRHPPLANGWSPPQLWTPIPGTALRGKSRPQPPSPWPGIGGAYAVYPVPTSRKEAPTPVVVGYVPGEFRPIAPVENPLQRVGFLDRPYRLFFRRR